MSEGKKYDSGKAKMHLLPPKALFEVIVAGARI